MRSFLMVVAAAAFLAAGASAAWAQGEFPLKYVLAEGNDPLTNTGLSNRGNTSTRPPHIKALPEGLSGKVRYFMFEWLGRESLWAVLDTASPPKLYVDLAGTGDLSSVAPLVGKASGHQWCYGPIDISTGSGEGAPGVKVLFVSIEVTMFVVNIGIAETTCVQDLSVRAAGYMAGDVKLDGQTYRVAVLDKNLNGRYESAFGADGKSVPWWLTDVIAIDSNQDGKFRGAMGAGEIVPLSKAVSVKGRYYRVEVAPDGSSIKFEKYEPKMGTLDLGTAASLTLMSDTGMHNLSGADGKWQVPEGRYTCQSLSITRTDAEGKVWTLNRMDMGPLAKFEVRGGETTAIKIGPPLALKVDAVGPPSGGEIVLNLALAGKAGETYWVGLEKGGLRLPAPKVKVLDASGKILAQGDSGFG